MARRTNTPASPAPGPPPPPPPRDPAVIEHSDPEWAANLRILRRNWKWATFSQFFYTFAPLLNMPDVMLGDIEDDLARGTSLYLPRVMHRLLYVLSQDRKLSIDNWQTGLRKQYMKRDPAANPIGPEPPAPSRQPSTIPDELLDEDAKYESAGPSSDAPAPPEDAVAGEAAEGDQQKLDGPSTTHGAVDEDEDQPGESGAVSAARTPSVKRESSLPPQPEVLEESKDWLELPMPAKLDSLHTVQEWQFQNPQRVRQGMRSDDEYATWRIEPIGYDAKTNAYWLIGPDRLWLQRVPPKPPKGTKRKRPVTPKKKQPDPEAEYESEPIESPKRRRAGVQSQPAVVKPSQPSTARASRSRAKAVVEEPVTPSGSKSTRAAKLQANKKLDAQAKELAEFQRQAAALERSRARGSASPAKHMPRGTRASARLRGASGKDEDEWQQIPDEWLGESAAPEKPALPKPVKPNTRKGKGRQVEEDEDEEQEEPVQAERELLKTGLESDESSSELTELSDVGEDESGAAEAVAAEEPPPQKKGKGSNGRQMRSSRSKVKGKTAQKQPKGDADAIMEEAEVVPEPAAEDSSWMPADFVEWEAICVTLEEWEHISERFEKATHYLEKALYKVLSQHFVPEITAQLRESDRRRKMEEAIVRRKRSSRIAHKETEREEARAAAQRRVEEEEKMSRQKRLEARAKKEEAEREKREKAREQRRIEREEREKRAAAKEERAQRAETEAEAEAASTSSAPSRSRSHKKTQPAANGTHSSDSVQLSRMSTPSGVRSPDWILNCEICGKSGINVDDGQPMVSCGMCQKWQHIPCHDLADARAGRPKRNWTSQSFFCQTCRSGRSNGLSYGMAHQQSYIPVHQPGAFPSSDPVVHLQKTGPSTYPYAQPSSDMRYPQHQENGMYAQQQYAQPKVGTQSGSFVRHQQPGGITFAHYQPEQRMFSTTGAPQAQQRSYAPQQHAAFNLQFPPHQYSQSGYASAGFGSSRTPVPYPTHSPAPQPHAYDSGSSSHVPSHNGMWNGDTSVNATQAAADALTFMQGMGSSWPQQPVDFAPSMNGNGVANHSHQGSAPPDPLAPTNQIQLS